MDDSDSKHLGQDPLQDIKPNIWAVTRQTQRAETHISLLKIFGLCIKYKFISLPCMTQVGMVVHSGPTAIPVIQYVKYCEKSRCKLCIFIRQRYFVPCSYSLSCQNERLFLFGQAVESHYTRGKPTGSHPFPPRNTATGSTWNEFDSVDWRSFTAEDLCFP